MNPDFTQKSTTFIRGKEMKEANLLDFGVTRDMPLGHAFPAGTHQSHMSFMLDYPQPVGYYCKPTPTHTGEVQSVCASSWMIPATEFGFAATQGWAYSRARLPPAG